MWDTTQNFISSMWDTRCFFLFLIKLNLGGGKFFLVWTFFACKKLNGSSICFLQLGMYVSLSNK